MELSYLRELLTSVHGLGITEYVMPCMTEEDARCDGAMRVFAYGRTVTWVVSAYVAAE